MNKVVLLLLISTSLQASPSDFVQQAIEKTSSLVAKILKHPFLTEMANGTLSEQRFHYFEVQDNIYCWRYSDALNVLARKSSNYTEKQFFMNASMGSIQEWGGIHPEPIKACPSCQAYSDFEFRAAEESFGAGIAAIMPCYTIYWEVANWLKNHSVPNNPYESWINRYADDPNFEKHIAMLEEFANRVFNDRGTIEQRRMLEAYYTAVQFEWQFWNSAYELAKWEPTDEQP